MGRIVQKTVLLLIAFLLVVTRMTGPVEQIHQAAQQFTHLLGAYEKMRSFQRELALAAREHRKAADVPYPEGTITFERVTYQHDPPRSASNDDALRSGVRDLELIIEQGEFLAVTGASGVGKTTFADLLAGLHAPQSGRIVVGKRDLEEAVATWRKELAYVPQDPFLFHDTIRRNLTWASPGAGESEMWRTLAATGADRLIQEMERGLDSVVGERGALVSGGERQRIALARALLRNPRLLILDEATSALDSDAERNILLQLRGTSPRMTIVLIAQRTDNLDACDRVIRLKMAEGKTVATAIHPRRPDTRHSLNAAQR